MWNVLMEALDVFLDMLQLLEGSLEKICILLLTTASGFKRKP